MLNGDETSARQKNYTVTEEANNGQIITSLMKIEWLQIPPSPIITIENPSYERVRLVEKERDWNVVKSKKDTGGELL